MTARRFDWDPAKSAKNVAERGLPFEVARQFDFDLALIVEDDRREYGEKRMIATGFIGMRLHVLVYAERGDEVRVISLRKANSREVRRYDDFAQTQT